MAMPIINYTMTCCKGRTNLNLLFLRFFVFLFSISIFFFSCKKDLGTVGANLIEVRNNLNPLFNDTLNLSAYTTQMDSLSTGFLNYYILGAINDLDFGETKSDIVTSFSLPGDVETFSLDSVKIDSVVLQLHYGSKLNFYGDLNSTHTIKVYELAQSLSKDSTYHSTRKPVSKTTAIGDFSGKFNLNDSIKNTFYNPTTKVPPCFRIKLNADAGVFQQKFRTKLQKSSLSTLFSGLVISDETNFNSNQGAFVYFNFGSIYSKVIVYYNDSARAEFPISWRIPLADSDPRFNYYEHKNLPNGFLQNRTNGVHRDTCFLQSMAGTKIHIDIPNSIFNFVASNKNVAVNAAEMVFTLQDNSTSTFAAPSRLLLISSDSLGYNNSILDAILEDSSYYGGVLIGNQYRFNIARHIQNLFYEYSFGYNVNYGLNLIVPNGTLGSIFPATSSRAIFNTQKGGKNFKLNLTLTVVK